MVAAGASAGSSIEGLGIRLRVRGSSVSMKPVSRNAYKDLITKLIDKFGSASPAEITKMLLPKLPDALNAPQKRNKIRNLVQNLQREGLIHNVGKHGPGARWTRKTPDT